MSHKRYRQKNPNVPVRFIREDKETNRGVVSTLKTVRLEPRAGTSNVPKRRDSPQTVSEHVENDIFMEDVGPPGLDKEASPPPPPRRSKVFLILNR